MPEAEAWFWLDFVGQGNTLQTDCLHVADAGLDDRFQLTVVVSTFASLCTAWVASWVMICVLFWNGKTSQYRCKYTGHVHLAA